jgi:hypothetical protein
MALNRLEQGEKRPRSSVDRPLLPGVLQGRQGLTASPEEVERDTTEALRSAVSLRCEWLAREAKRDHRRGIGHLAEDAEVDV